MSVDLSPKVVSKIVNAPDALNGHIGTPDSRAKKIGEAFSAAMSAHRSAGGKPNQTIRFTVPLSQGARSPVKDMKFSGRLIRDKSTGKLSRAVVTSGAQ